MKNSKTHSDFNIYVASLSHYNQGILKGTWLDIDNLSGDEIKDKIQEYLDSIGVEEYAIHDHEGLDPIYSEYPNFYEVSSYIKACNEFTKEAVESFVISFSISELDDFNDLYMGKYDSEEEFATEFIESTGELDQIPEVFRYYFDYDMYARDLFIENFTFNNGFVFMNI